MSLFGNKKRPRPKAAEVKVRRVGFDVIKFWYVKNCFFGTAKRVEFYRIIRSLTTNGVSIQAALKLYSEMLGKYSKGEWALRYILDDLLKMMAQGTRYEKAISVWIPPEELVLIQSSAKDVAKACEIITKFTENFMSIKSALVGSLTYPSMMLLVLVGCLAAFAFFIMPAMIQMSSPSSWPSEARALYSFTTFISKNIVPISVAFVSFFVFMGWSMNNLTYMPLRRILDKIPPWSIYKPYLATTFMIALAALLRSGTSYNQSIKDVKLTASPYLTVYLNMILKKLAAGGEFGDSMEIGLFEGNVLISLTVFARTNRLEQGIQFLADENLEEQRQAFIAKGKILGYVMMFLVAGVIGWVMLSLYGMQSSIKG